MMLKYTGLILSFQVFKNFCLKFHVFPTVYPQEGNCNHPKTDIMYNLPSPATQEETVIFRPLSLYTTQAARRKCDLSEFGEGKTRPQSFSQISGLFGDETGL